MYKPAESSLRLGLHGPLSVISSTGDFDDVLSQLDINSSPTNDTQAQAEKVSASRSGLTKPPSLMPPEDSSSSSEPPKRKAKVLVFTPPVTMTKALSTGDVAKGKQRQVRMPATSSTSMTSADCIQLPAASGVIHDPSPCGSPVLATTTRRQRAPAPMSRPSSARVCSKSKVAKDPSTLTTTLSAEAAIQLLEASQQLEAHSSEDKDLQQSTAFKFSSVRRSTTTKKKKKTKKKTTTVGTKKRPVAVRRLSSSRMLSLSPSPPLLPRGVSVDTHQRERGREWRLQHGFAVSPKKIQKQRRSVLRSVPSSPQPVGGDGHERMGSFPMQSQTVAQAIARRSQLHGPLPRATMAPPMIIQTHSQRPTPVFQRTAGIQTPVQTPAALSLAILMHETLQKKKKRRKKLAMKLAQLGVKTPAIAKKRKKMKGKSKKKAKEKDLMKSKAARRTFPSATITVSVSGSTPVDSLSECDTSSMDSMSSSEAPLMWWTDSDLCSTSDNSASDSEDTLNATFGKLMGLQSDTGKQKKKKKKKKWQKRRERKRSRRIHESWGETAKLRVRKVTDKLQRDVDAAAHSAVHFKGDRSVLRYEYLGGSTFKLTVRNAVTKRIETKEVYFTTGDVILAGTYVGVLRYMGPMATRRRKKKAASVGSSRVTFKGELDEEIYLGIECAETVRGGHNGTYAGHFYFRTSDKRLTGVLLPLTAYTKTLDSWELLQIVFKQKVALNSLTESFESTEKQFDKLESTLTDLRKVSNELLDECESSEKTLESYSLMYGVPASLVVHRSSSGPPVAAQSSSMTRTKSTSAVFRRLDALEKAVSRRTLVPNVAAAAAAKARFLYPLYGKRPTAKMVNSRSEPRPAVVSDDKKEDSAIGSKKEKKMLSVIPSQESVSFFERRQIESRQSLAAESQEKEAMKARDSVSVASCSAPIVASVAVDGDKQKLRGAKQDATVIVSSSKKAKTKKVDASKSRLQKSAAISVPLPRLSPIHSDVPSVMPKKTLYAMGSRTSQKSPSPKRESSKRKETSGRTPPKASQSSTPAMESIPKRREAAAVHRTRPRTQPVEVEEAFGTPVATGASAEDYFYNYNGNPFGYMGGMPPYAMADGSFYGQPMHRSMLSAAGYPAMAGMQPHGYYTAADLYAAYGEHPEYGGFVQPPLPVAGVGSALDQYLLQQQRQQHAYLQPQFHAGAAHVSTDPMYSTAPVDGYYEYDAASGRLPSLPFTDASGYYPAGARGTGEFLAADYDSDDVMDSLSRTLSPRKSKEKSKKPPRNSMEVRREEQRKRSAAARKSSALISPSPASEKLSFTSKVFTSLKRQDIRDSGLPSKRTEWRPQPSTPEIADDFDDDSDDDDVAVDMGDTIRFVDFVQSASAPISHKYYASRTSDTATATTEETRADDYMFEDGRMSEMSIPLEQFVSLSASTYGLDETELDVISEEYSRNAVCESEDGYMLPVPKEGYAKAQLQSDERPSMDLNLSDESDDEVVGDSTADEMSLSLSGDRGTDDESSTGIVGFGAAGAMWTGFSDNE